MSTSGEVRAMVREEEDVLVQQAKTIGFVENVDTCRTSQVLAIAACPMLKDARQRQ